MSNAADNKAVYRMIRSVNKIDGKTVVMYGIEGVCVDERMILSALSDNSLRISALVDNLNEGQFELCLLRDVVRDFLFDFYGIGSV